MRAEGDGGQEPEQRGDQDDVEELVEVGAQGQQRDGAQIDPRQMSAAMARSATLGPRMARTRPSAKARARPAECEVDEVHRVAL